jgi:hypothetical protein
MSGIISPKTFISQRSLEIHSPQGAAFLVPKKTFYEYTEIARNALLSYEIDNVKTEAQRELRISMNLPDKVLMFKAGKFEDTFENHILGPYKYSAEEHFFSNGKKLACTFIGQCSRGLRMGIGH